MNSRQFQHMQRQRRGAIAGLLPVALGVVWLVSGWNSGVAAGVLASMPGVLFTGAGASLLIWPGDRQVNHYLALGAAVSMVFAVAFAWLFGLVETVLLIVGGAGCYVLAGYMALYLDAIPAAVPAPRLNFKLALKAALDETMLGWFMASTTIPRGEAARRDRVELEQLEELIRQRDWVNNPQTLHRPPQSPEQFSIEPVHYRKWRFDWLQFDSEYTPPEGVPGTRHWQSHQANQSMYARVFCHADRPRPWLLCLHGYRMGLPAMDFSLFNIDHLHHDLGLNLLMPILPLHGPRRAGRISGRQFLDGPMAHVFHAETQSLWDIRRCLSWLHAHHEVPRIGALGFSLGGYNAALLAAFEPALACVIAGIPLTDIPGVLWRHLPTADRRYIEACGVEQAWVSRIMAPVSPLHLPSRVAHERRFIFAATGDQLVPPEQPLALWQHWQQPSIYWYHGSHLSARQERGVPRFIDQALLQSDLVMREQELAQAHGL